MNRWLKYALIAAAVVVAAGLFYTYSSPLRISSEEARRLIKDGAKVVDVRTDTERATLGHYPQDIHIPSAALKHSAGAQLNKNEHIVLYCNSGQRARKAAETLQELGYKNVHYIAGPYTTLMEK